ncbi:MAG: cupin domain-containing protein [Chloroflexota bacterium]
MRGSMKDLPVSLEIPEGKMWQVDWGGNTVEFGKFKQVVDPAPLFKGLPDDRCQCPHWGYVIKGRLRYRFKDHEEVYEAGDAYYVSPGHTPVLEAGVEYVEFSPSAELAKTMEVVGQNMQMMDQV